MSTFIYCRASYDPDDDFGSVDTQTKIGLAYLESQWATRCNIESSMRQSGKTQAEIDLALARYPDQQPICDRLWDGKPFNPIVVENNVRTKVPLDRRPKGGIMYRLLQAGDHVIVTRLDRLCRNFVEFVNTFRDWSQRGIFLHFVKDFGGVLDESNPMSWALVHIRAIIAELEKRILRERTIEGQAHKKTTGERMKAFAGIGRKFVWKRNPQNKWFWMEEIDENEVVVVNAMYKWFKNGTRVCDIYKHIEMLRKQQTPEQLADPNMPRYDRQKLRLKKSASPINGRYRGQDYVETRIPWSRHAVSRAVQVAAEWEAAANELKPKEDTDAA